jgi:Raf kinase inhibitor-like YbhB/YbcL family protein
MAFLKHLLWIVPLLPVAALAVLSLKRARAWRAEDAYHTTLPKTLQVSSTSFPAGGVIPKVYTCKGANTSPQLAWTGTPTGTKSFAIIATDWDGPGPPLRLMEIVHWVVYNIPEEVRAFAEDESTDSFSAGKNISGETKFEGPCPPVGKHAYLFRVYALDVVRLDPATNDKAGLLNAMQGHILAYGELTGYRSRSD